MVRKCWLWYGKPKLTCPDLEQIGTCLSYEGWTDEEKVKRYHSDSYSLIVPDYYIHPEIDN
jgi:hypothetical protein